MPQSHEGNFPFSHEFLDHPHGGQIQPAAQLNQRTFRPLPLQMTAANLKPDHQSGGANKCRIRASRRIAVPGDAVRQQGLQPFFGWLFFVPDT